MQRVLLFFFLALAIAVDGFFALVNFYPVAPPHSRGPRRYVVAELDPSQARWFQENLLDAYNDENDADVHLRVVETEKLLESLAGTGGHAPDALLAVLPRELAVQAARARTVQPFEGAVTAESLREDLDAVEPQAVADASLDGRQWFMPRSTVLDVEVFRVSRVRDAELHWSLVRPQIEAALRAVNGRGLPADYVLEHDATQWDSYDQFVLAWYWAHRRYEGAPARPRVAHRAGYGPDAYIDLASALHRMGGTDATLAQYDSQPARDFFAWEGLYRRHGLYPEAMYGDNEYDDEALLEGLESGELYIGHIDQMEAFTLHGGSHRGTPSHVTDPDDLGFVAVPRGASLALDAAGLPARHGEGFSFRESAVWALPSHSPDVNLAASLVHFLLSRENHYRECEALGMMPLRRDVVRERASIFRLAWMSEVFNAGFTQWSHSQLVPPSLVADGIGARYAGLWDTVVAHRSVAPEQTDALALALRTVPPPHTAAPPADDAHEADAPAHEPQPQPTAVSDTDDDPPMAVSPDTWRTQVVLETGDAGTGEGGAAR